MYFSYHNFFIQEYKCKMYKYIWTYLKFELFGPITKKLNGVVMSLIFSKSTLKED